MKGAIVISRKAKYWGLIIAVISIVVIILAVNALNLLNPPRPYNAPLSQYALNKGDLTGTWYVLPNELIKRSDVEGFTYTLGKNSSIAENANLRISAVMAKFNNTDEAVDSLVNKSDLVTFPWSKQNWTFCDVAYLLDFSPLNYTSDSFSAWVLCVKGNIGFWMIISGKATEFKEDLARSYVMMQCDKIH